jgi:uncharacterized protein (DUF302 family)
MQEAHVLIFGNPKAGTPLMIASPLLALDLPLKVLVWQSGDSRVWMSYTSILTSLPAIPSHTSWPLTSLELTHWLRALHS